MWFMAVYSKAWLLLWNTDSSLSLREGGSSLPSGSTRWRQLPHGMGSISHRFTMPTDHWRTDLMPDGMVERLSLWAVEELSVYKHAIMRIKEDNYSWRSATIGSTSIARRAGM